jgi:uncharacterized membrane protein
MNKRILSFTNKEIAIGGLLLAFILIFTFVPVHIGPVSLAFFPLIAAIVASQAVNKKMGIVISTLFGIFSLVSAIAVPNIFSPLFYNPLVSIVPRICIGLSTFYSFKGMLKITTALENRKKLKGKKSALYISSTVSAIVGVLTNTTLVLSMIAVFYFGDSFGEYIINSSWILGLLSVNFLLELAICAIIIPPIVVALWAITGKQASEIISLNQPKDSIVKPETAAEEDKSAQI